MILEKRSWLRSACAILAALAICMGVLAIARTQQLAQANSRISAVYQKAFYETCELTEAVAANYRKLLVAGEDGQMQALLGEISRQTQGAAGNLALLPLGEETVSATIKFINQAEDFAESLSSRLAIGGEVTEQDLDVMAILSARAGEFTAAMEALLESYERGETVFDAEDYAETGGESLYPLTGEAADYPVLLYDGPFSDGEAAGNYEYLSAMPEISAREAEDRLRSMLAVDELRYTGESQPEVACYEFYLRCGEYGMSAGVTKQGGALLYLLPESQVSEVYLSEEELYPLAEAFLRAQGYGEMEMSYVSRFGGILTINYAAVQDGVVIYPELVKLQLSMKDGGVIGLDARSYLKNHRQRSLPAPAMSAQEAMGRVSGRLQSLSARLCVIPQSGAEYLCYEVSAANADGDFLVYIDALTGAERELMQVISRENGTLVM